MEGQGLILTIISDPAVEGAAQFQRATEVANTAAQKLDVSVAKLDTDLAKSGASFSALSTQMQVGSQQATAFGKGVGDATYNTVALGDALTKTQATARTTGRALQTDLVRSATGAQGSIRELARALLNLGTTSINSSIRGVGSALKAIPTVGLAVGVAQLTTGLLEFVLASNEAEDTTEKYARQLQQADDALRSVADAQAQLNKTFLAATADQRVAGLKAQLDATRNAMIDLQQASRRAGQDLAISFESAAEALDIPDSAFAKFQRARELVQQGVRPGVFGDEANELRRILLQLEGSIPLRIENNDLVVKASEVSERLARSLAITNKELERQSDLVRRAAAEDVSTAVQEFVHLRERENDLLRKGNEERKVLAGVLAVEDTLKRKLNEVEVAAIAPILQQAVARDQAAAAAKAQEKAQETLARQQQKEAEAAAKVRQERDAAERSLQAFIDGLQRQSALLTVEGEARDELATRFELEQLLRERNIDLTNQERDAIEKIIVRIREQTTLLNQRKRAEEEAQAAAKRDKERAQEFEEFNRAIDQEIRLLQTVGIERHEAALQIDIENTARRLGVDLLSEEGRLIEGKMRLLDRLTVQEEEANALRLAAQTALRQQADVVVDHVERAIFEGGKARDILRALYQDLARLAFRQAASAGLDALFGAPTGNYVGGVIPAPRESFSGRVIDEYSVFQRGRRTYSVAEGGPNTPEAVLPLTRDSQGRLAVSSVGGGGGTVVQNISFPGVRSAREARAIRPTLAQATADADAARRRSTRIGLRM